MAQDKLYNIGYGQTDYLKDLVSGERFPTTTDVMSLWKVFQDAEGYVGQPGTLEDFGKWIAGVEPFENPCEVTW